MRRGITKFLGAVLTAAMLLQVQPISAGSSMQAAAADSAYSTGDESSVCEDADTASDADEELLINGDGQSKSSEEEIISQASSEASESSEPSVLAESEESSSSESAASPVIRPAPRRTPANSSVQAEGVYIRSFSTQCFYGGTQESETIDGNTYKKYTWYVPTSGDTYQKGHAFSFRINMAISGEKETPEGAVTITIPASILKNRAGESDDHIEMSVPSKSDVEAAAAGTGEAIDSDVNFAYYEDGDNIVIYNIHTLPSGYNGYIELSYVTDSSSFSYADTGLMNPFTAEMKINSTAAEATSASADPIYTAIDTTALINSTEKYYPTLYKSWQSEWGTAPDSSNSYWYLLWDIRSNISATQPYTLAITDTPEKAQERKDGEPGMNEAAHDLIAIRFSGQSWQSASNGTGVTEDSTLTGRGYRYDYAVTRIPMNSDIAECSVQNNVSVTVTPADQKDEATSAEDSGSWHWTRPYFAAPTGHVMAYKRADGAYRRYNPNGYSIYNWTTHYASSKSMKAGEYSRYDLEEYRDNWDENSTELYDGLDYASWVVGWTYPWTVDSSKAYENPQDAYGKNAVTTVLEDDGVYATTAGTIQNAAESHFPGSSDTGYTRLTEDDFKIEAIDFSWFFYDALYNEDTCRYENAEADYTTPQTVEMYVKTSTAGDWISIGRMSLTSASGMTSSLGSGYVKSTDGNRITFQDSISVVAYKLKVSNTKYYTELFTVPDIALKENSPAMKTILNIGSKDALGAVSIVNNNTGYWYASDSEDADRQIAEVPCYDVNYLRDTKRASEIKKNVVSTYNNVKSRYYTITWGVKMAETATYGAGEVLTIPQTSGIYYDLLPKGAVFSRKSVQVTDAVTRKDITSFAVQTIQNYKNTGRTMLIVEMNEEGKEYYVTFDTIHSWNTIKDYGPSVYNPVAYETGNSSIAEGFPDNGGKQYADGTENTSSIKDADLMASLDDRVADSDTTNKVKKFIYAETDWDISAITAASSGLAKKVKADSDLKYSYETMTTINGLYSYEVRYQNTYTTKAEGLIFFDSLENYDATGTAEAKAVGASDWHGTVQSIDTAQLRKMGIRPAVYVYTGATELALDGNTAGVSADEDYDFAKHTDVWTKLSDTDLEDLTAWQEKNGKITGIAVDCRTASDGNGFILDPGSSVMFRLYMKAPDTAPDAENGGYPYAYNNIYLKDTIIGDTGSRQSFYIHQDYTSIGLVITGDLRFHKANKDNHDESVPGITYRVTGTSDYGTAVDEKVTTDRSGNGIFEKIEKGTYLLQEYETNDDWLMDPAEHTLQVTDKGKVLVDGVDYTNPEGSTEKHYDFYDQYVIHGDLKFTKKELTNSTGTTLLGISGVKFKLSGTSDYGVKITKYAVSDESGSVSFTNVQKGTYELQETEMPAGKPYVLSDRIYQVVCDDTGTVSITGEIRDGKLLPAYTGIWDEASMRGKDTEWVSSSKNGNAIVYNEQRYFPLTLFKYEVRKDADGNNVNVGLAGAKFTLTGTSDLGTVINASAESDSDGIVTFLDSNQKDFLEKGTYLLEETKAPKTETTLADGTRSSIDYVKDESRYIVTIDYRGNISIVNYDNNNQEVSKDPQGNFLFSNTRIANKKITITKVWDDDDVANSSRPIPQITITTYDPAYPKAILKFNPNGGTWSDKSTDAKQASFLLKTDSNGSQYYEPYSGSKTAANIAKMVANSDKTGIVMTGAVLGEWNSTDSSGNVYTYKVDSNGNITKFDSDGKRASLSKDGETLTAKWNLPTLTTGKKFNITIKKLAGQSNPSAYTYDSSIKTVKLTTEAPGSGTTTADVSADGDGSIKAWFGGGTIYLYASGVNKIALNADSSNLFSDCALLTSVDASDWDTGKVTDMYSMFYNCNTLTSLDVSGWDTGNVTNMSHMFYNCKTLTSLDVSGWNTGKVTNMYRMFYNCNALTSLDVSGWDTGKVTRMDGMFRECKNLTTLDVSGWSTGNVTNISAMFKGCSTLTSLDVSGWNTGSVTSMNSMFMGCSSLTSLDVSGWNTGNVTSMSGMFEGCYKLTTIYAGNGWNTGKVPSSSAMFSGDANLVGGAGTKYSSSYVDKTYAHIDGGTSNPGYLTAK